MLASNGLFYGVTLYGGTYNVGTIYSANTLGQKGVIYNFNSNPVGSVIQKPLLQATNGILYGTTHGGFSDNGVIYSCDTSGNFGVIHNFSLITGGTKPIAGLIQATNGILYGTTYLGGLNNNGVIYSCDTSGNFGVIVLNTSDTIIQFNSSLIQASNGILYGTSESGLNNDGILFSCSTSGNWGIVLDFSAPGIYGTTPYSIIEASNGYLYGVCLDGGPAGLNRGVLYKTTKNGQYTLIHEFSGITYGDGQAPQNQLFQANDGTIYGTTTIGGIFNKGTIFTVDQNDNYNIIHHFSGQTYFDGDYPKTTLIQGNDGNLYGTTFQGGTPSNTGTIFKLAATEITGCTYNTSVDVPCYGPLTLSVSAVTIPCTGNTGVISVSATGGVPPYVFRLGNGLTVYFKSGTTNSVISFSGLSPSSWRAQVTDFSGNTDISVMMLSLIGVDLDIIGQSLCVNVTGESITRIHSIYIDNVLKFTSTNNPFNGQDGGLFTKCFTNLSGCGVFHTLKVVDIKTGCYFQKPFKIFCDPLTFTGFSTSLVICPTDTNNVTLGVSGGSQPYNIVLQRTSPSLITQSATTITYNPPTSLTNYATAKFSVAPSSGTWFAKVTDFNNTTITTSSFNLTSQCYANAVFNLSNVAITYSGAGDYGIVTVNGTTYPPKEDGTYTYPTLCGYNTVVVQLVTNSKNPPTTICTYTFTADTICPLGTKSSFIQPVCPGTKIQYLQVDITGGTPDYSVSVTDGNVTYTAVTPNTSVTFYSAGTYPITITGGTWTITTTDNYGSVYNENIYVDPTFDAFVSQAFVSGASITISGGTPLYNITIDSTNYGNNFNNGTYNFALTSGSHTATISQPFASNTCVQTFNFNVPFAPLVGSVVYSNPTCGNDIGSALVRVTGGTGLYTYTMSNGVNTYVSSPPLSAYPSYSFNGLGAGTWQINVIDSDGSTYNDTITMTSNFSVSVSAVTINSYSIGNVCINIQGGTPPYNIYIDNIIKISATTNTYHCITATTNTNHTYKVVDSSPPATIYTNVKMINDPTFDVPTNWTPTLLTNCTNPSLPNYGLTGGTIISGGKITYTSTTTVSGIGNGCNQNYYFRENYINPNPFTVGKPITATYQYMVDFGERINIVYAVPLFLTPITGAYDLNFVAASQSNGSVTPPIPGAYLNNTTYSGLITIKTNNTITYPPVVFSGYGIFTSMSGSYGNVGQLQYRGFDLTLVNYTVNAVCTITGTTYISAIPSPNISLVGFTNPSCESASDGSITVLGSSGVPPYVYSATNGTTSYTSLNGIFNGLNQGTWYLSLVDYLGVKTTLAQPITLYDTFYANVQSYSNGYCLTITGGTQPYYAAIDNNPLVWDYNFDKNCYTANCNTVSVITVRDSS